MDERGRNEAVGYFEDCHDSEDGLEIDVSHDDDEGKAEPDFGEESWMNFDVFLLLVFLRRTTLAL